MMTFILVAMALAAAGQTAPPGTFQMTSAEVQACGALALDRNNRDAELSRRDAELSTERSALEARQAEVEAQRATVKTDKKKDVAKFNALIESTNAAATAFQPKIAARNAYLAESKTVVDAFNAKCTHRSLNPADLAALPADQRAAFGQISTKTIMVPGRKKAATKR